MTTYRAADGDRLDTICYVVFGDLTNLPAIMALNPFLPVVLTAGTLVNLPPILPTTSGTSSMMPIPRSDTSAVPLWA